MTPEAQTQSCEITLSKYRLLREIGRGNMGSVYLGRDLFIDRFIAVKVAHQERLICPETSQVFQQLFFNEARTAGMLMHPNITAIFDAGIEGYTHYIVMEYVPGGQTLADFCNVHKLLSLDGLIRIFYRCALALDYAHKKGVVHRDIKPKNILLTPEHDVKISDFGIAVPAEGVDPATLDLAGSPLYMSPEQVKHEPLTGQSDLFSLGVVMYRALTGKHPFMADKIAAINLMTLNAEPAPLRQVRSDLPEVMERIVKRAMAKDPARRYKTGIDIAGDLTLVLDQVQFAS